MIRFMDNKVKAIKVDMAQYKPVDAMEKFDRKGWVVYGPDNLYPNYLIDLYESAPVHGALTTSIIEMITGKEFAPNPQVEQYNLNSIRGDISYDLKLQGGFYLEVILTIDKTDIAAINHLPFESCRMAYAENEDGVQVFTGIYFSKDWSRANKKGYEPRYIPKMSQGSEEPRQSFWHFTKLTKSRAYPKPDYEKSLTWIEVEKQIGIYHMNNLLNGLFPAFMIHMMNGQKDPEEAAQIKKDFEKRLGAENAGGFMMTFNESGSEAPKVDTFPISDADKQYQFLSGESTSKIMIGHRVTSPLLFGIRGEGGGLGSNKDEMVAGYKLFFSQVIEPFQRFICNGLEELFAIRGIQTQFSIVPNDFILNDVPAQADGGGEADVAAQALNGAQIASMIEIIIQVATGVIPIESAKAITKASFPTLTPEQIDDIFTGIVPGSVSPTEIAQKVVAKLRAHLEKKKPELSNEDAEKWSEFLTEIGQEKNEDWIEIDSWEVDYKEEDADEVKYSVSTGSARPNSESAQDKRIDGILYITRYRYAGGTQKDTRPFCRKMLEAAKLYRKEDVMAMKDKAVNPGWGPRGADTYSIWLYKGGGNCHHYWEKVVYVSAKDLGIDVNSPKAKEIAVSKASAAGYKVRNTPKVAQRPIDMPNQGFLPKD